MRAKLCSPGRCRDFPGHYETDGRVRVLLDGRDVKDFVAVDVATGVGVRAKRDTEGNFVVDRSREEIVEERVLGSFRVIPILLALILFCGSAFAQTGGRVANMRPKPPVVTVPSQPAPAAVVQQAIARAAATEAPAQIFADGFESAGGGGAPIPDVNACRDSLGKFLPGIQPPQLPLAVTRTWAQAFSAPACLSNPRDPRCKVATYPRSIGNPVPLGAAIAGYTVIPFVPIANQTVTLTWDQVQANPSIGYPKPRPADSMFIAISPCPGDLRAPDAASPIPWLENGCRRTGGGASLTNSTLPGVSSEYVCRLVAGQTYYYTVAPYNPATGFLQHTCSTSAVNSAAGCDVQGVSSGQ